jgi:hypothetical protein
MFCPQCGNKENGELKFCKTCGANLQAVRQAVSTREVGEKTNEKNEWGNNWVANMFLLPEEIKRRKRELQNSFDVEEKRYKEIKAGVITSCVGLALMIFLSIFMSGIIESGVPQNAAVILRHVWVAGVIPFFIGMGLIFNGLIVSKRLVDLAKREFQQRDTARILEATEKGKENAALASADWLEEPNSTSPSVTEHTTRQLRDSN